jgi:acetyl esterase/lipase
MGTFAHKGSVTALLGDHPSKELKDHYSLEKQVGPATPPAFIFQTAGDGSVPVENSGMFANAMKKAGVPFAYHVFTTGPHGLSIATEDWVNRVHCNIYTLDQVCRMLDQFQKGQLPEADPEYARAMVEKFEPRRNPGYINTDKQPNHEVAVWPVLADQWLRYVRGVTPCL